MESDFCNKPSVVDSNNFTMDVSNSDLKSILKPGEFKCKLCVLSFITNSGFEIHMEKVHNIASQIEDAGPKFCSDIVCDMCEFKSNHEAYLIQHINVFHEKENKQIKCNSCKLKFWTRIDLNAHIENKHRDENQSVKKLDSSTQEINFVDKILDNKMDSELLFDIPVYALQYEHSDGPGKINENIPNSENLPSLSGVKSENLPCKKSEKYWSSQKTFTCDKKGNCSATACADCLKPEDIDEVDKVAHIKDEKTSFDVKRVKRRPGRPREYKTYICRFCPQIFRCRSHRSEHEVGHTGIYPLNCEHCDKGFRKRAHYGNHMLRKHGVVVPKAFVGRIKGIYPCKFCDESFEYQTHYTEHVIQKHSNYEGKVLGL